MVEVMEQYNIELSNLLKVHEKDIEILKKDQKNKEKDLADNQAKDLA
jgi:hypothetical protein